MQRGLEGWSEIVGEERKKGTHSCPQAGYAQQQARAQGTAVKEGEAWERLRKGDEAEEDGGG